MALLTRAAARRQAASNGGSVNGDGATGSTADPVDATTNTRRGRSRSTVKEGGPALFRNAIGGVDGQCVVAKDKDTEAEEASQHNIPTEIKSKRTRQFAKTAAGSSRKKGNRTVTRQGAARAPLDNGGSDAETPGTRVATKGRKRALEEPTAPATDKGSSGDARPSVRRKVAEAPPAARTLRNSTNSDPTVPSSKEAASKQEEAEDDSDDDAPRFTRIEKGKFTEKEGIAASALIELLLVERVFSNERAAQPVTEGAVVPPPRTAPRRSGRLSKMRI